LPKIYKKCCDKCGKPYKGIGARFCSAKCAGIEKKYSECKHCGKVFHFRRGIRTMFCSRTCVDLYRKENPPIKKEKIVLECGWCKKSFEVIPSKSTRKYCTHHCAVLANTKDKKFWTTKIKHHSASLKGKYFNVKSRATKKRLSYPSRKAFVEWYEKQPKICSYCGITVEHWEMLYNGHQNKYSLTIDRKNNDVGYEISNMALACGKCNMIKNDTLEYEEMVEIGNKYIKPKWQKQILSIKEAHHGRRF
jgi:hypothetical protein